MLVTGVVLQFTVNTMLVSRAPFSEWGASRH